jgi:5-methylcytosine-specific restriction endonuclease McrA
MPLKDKTLRNEYMRKYVAERQRRRMAEAFELLGGECAICGSTSDLEVDHKDPTTKTFNIAEKAAGVSEVKLQAELLKCQLLCNACHTRKSILERGQLPREGRHGTLTMYRFCKCDECKAAKSTYTKSHPTYTKDNPRKSRSIKFSNRT